MSIKNSTYSDVSSNEGDTPKTKLSESEIAEIKELYQKMAINVIDMVEGKIDEQRCMVNIDELKHDVRSIVEPHIDLQS